MKECVGLILILKAGLLFPQVHQTTVFESGKEGHKIYRIPAIISTGKNHLIAFCEGRVNNASDFGDVNIVMKHSIDGGRTWSAVRTIVDYDSLQAGNPAPVVDYTDPEYPKGRIFLFYNTGNNHEGEVRKGNGLREVWYITSTDEGQTWNTPVNITTQTHRPKQPHINQAYNFTEDWRHYANTPGHAMQFTLGNFKGRIYVAANHSEGEPQPDGSDYFAHGFYSDDHGKTFRLSENVQLPGSNEAMAAECVDDVLMLNIRNQRGDKRYRIVAKSKDGGVHWDKVYFDKQLPDPVCQGSLITIHKRRNIVAFCNAADTIRRNNLTLRISSDGGTTWNQSFVIDTDNKSGKEDFTAYSDLVLINKITLGVIYERSNYKEIVFTT